MSPRFADGFRQDLRHAFRRLVKAPGVTAATVLTLAVGIGATTTIFSAVNALLLNPVGVRDPSRVVAIRVSYETPDLQNITISPADFVDVRDSRDVFAATAMATGGGVSYTAGVLPERLYRQRVTWQWFDVFGASPHLGRTFTVDDDRPDANRVAILEHRTWERLFGGDPSIVGETIELDHEPHEVVGVMGPDFRRPNLNLPAPHVWTPLGLPEAAYGPWSRFNEAYQAFARVRPDVPVEQARAFMEILTRRVRDGAEGGYARSAGWSLSAIPFVEFVVGDLRTRLLTLLGASAFVLLIACLNAAGLSLARVSRRLRELALRTALGASRRRLMREAFTESLVVAAGGVVTGAGMAMAAVPVIRRFAPPEVGDRLVIPVDGAMVAFTVAAGVASAVLFGLLPAWRAAVLAHTAVRDVDSAMTDRGRLSMQSSLVTLEIALTMMLLVGAGLFLRSLARLQEVDTGFRAEGVMTGSVELPRARFDAVGARADFYRAARERLVGLPGVAAAAVAVPIPFSGGETAGSFTIEGRVPGPGEPRPHGGFRLVSPDFFSALRIPIRRGRVFDERDAIGAEPVALVDENLARQYWTDDDPIGKRIRRTTSGAEWVTIVGVVGHVAHADLAAGSGAGVYYYPIHQRPPPIASFVVKSATATPPAASAVRRAIHAVDPARPVFDLRTMDARVSASLEARRFAVLLLVVFAATALLLAALGTYGVVGYRVGQRTKEMGTRMALGAQPGDVLRMIMRETLTLAALGLGLGAAGGFPVEPFRRGHALRRRSWPNSMRLCR